MDTRDKRFSMIGLGLDSLRVRPNPDGGFDTDDRAHLLPLYIGIPLFTPGMGTGNVRYSMIGLDLLWMRVFPEPDGMIGQMDRQHYVGKYRGIAFGGAAAVRRRRMLLGVGH